MLPYCLWKKYVCFLGIFSVVNWMQKKSIEMAHFHELRYSTFNILFLSVYFSISQSYNSYLRTTNQNGKPKKSIDIPKWHINHSNYPCNIAQMAHIQQSIFNFVLWINQLPMRLLFAGKIHKFKIKCIYSQQQNSILLLYSAVHTTDFTTAYLNGEFHCEYDKRT